MNDYYVNSCSSATFTSCSVVQNTGSCNTSTTSATFLTLNKTNGNNYTLTINRNSVQPSQNFVYKCTYSTNSYCSLPFTTAIIADCNNPSNYLNLTFTLTDLTQKQMSTGQTTDKFIETIYATSLFKFPDSTCSFKQCTILDLSGQDCP